MDRILIVEDDLQLQREIAGILGRRYSVTTAINGATGLDYLAKGDFALCLLDVNLPDLSGFAVCQKLRGFSKVPVVFLTVRDDESSIIHGLDCGGDDYITKPFSSGVLLSRVSAQLRRKKMYERPAETVKSGGFVLDHAQGLLQYRGTPIPITRLEGSLLWVFMSNPDCLLTREQLLGRIWDDREQYVESNTLTVNISRLRKKLRRENGKNPIQTVTGIGYRWIGEEP